MDDTPRLDLDQPFTTAQFLKAGHEPWRLRRREFQQVLGGVWVRASAWDDDTRTRAALLLHPDDAVASHHSAARIHGLPVPEHAFEHVTVFKPEHRHFRAGVKSHVTTRRRGIVRRRGMRVTDALTTFIQMAGQLGIVDLVVLGDAIVRKLGISPSRLRAACEESTDYYAGLARAGAALVRAGVDSPMESRLRMLLVLAGLPEPTVDFKIRDEDGHVLRRYDLIYESVGLIVEYDGRQHAEDTRQWQGDLTRREEIDDAGRRILVVTGHDYYRDPAGVLARVRRQLILRGYGEVPQIKESWREHFSA